MEDQHLEQLVALGVVEEDLKTTELLVEVEVTLVAGLGVDLAKQVVEGVLIVHHHVAILLQQVGEIQVVIMVMSK